MATTKTMCIPQSRSTIRRMTICELLDMCDFNFSRAKLVYHSQKNIRLTKITMTREDLIYVCEYNVDYIQWVISLKCVRISESFSHNTNVKDVSCRYVSPEEARGGRCGWIYSFGKEDVVEDLHVSEISIDEFLRMHDYDLDVARKVYSYGKIRVREEPTGVIDWANSFEY